MKEIRRILCPIDFSDTSRQALEHAVAIAKWYSATVVALHVRVPHFTPPILMVGFADASSSSTAWSDMEALRAWLEPAAGAGVATSYLVDDGPPAARIVDLSRSESIDLIVMGTHGLSGFERLVLGSVAERVLRKATCPVLTVPPAATADRRVPYTRLLCAVDFSTPSLEALAVAASLAEESDAALTILHVLEWPSDTELLVNVFDPPDLREEVERKAQAQLDGLLTDEMKTWCRPTTMLGDGKPYREILRTAATEKSDLIIMGVHGRNPIDLTLFGSTTNHVVRQASCPVLTLKR